MTSTERRTLLFKTDADLESDCTFSFIKGGGNGGQKVNKTSSSVRLYHAETDISIVCRDTRSQSQNRHIAVQRLREKIAIQERCEIDADAPGFSVEPVPSVTNPAYPIWLADLLDRVALCNWDLKDSAIRLNVTRSHLTKILQRSPAVWQHVLYNFSVSNKKNHNSNGDTQSAGKDNEQ